jgi:hypothetical protein
MTHRPKVGISASIATLAILFLTCAAPASAQIYGSTPLNISTGPNGEAPNGPSGDPTVSGDNRVVRYVGFDSVASNLVGGDSNGVSDIFVWRRPSGVPNQLGDGRLTRVSLNNDGAQLDGASVDPSIDGSLGSRPHCVAFQSAATNAAAGDRTSDWDIFVRSLRTDRTIQLSVRVPGDAVNPAIAGDCSRVAFEASGSVWVSDVDHPHPRPVGRGSDPDFSLDGNSLAYVGSDGVVVFRHGSTKRRLSAGSDPRVSDHSPEGGWAVTYDAGGDLRMGFIDGGRTRITTAVRNARNGGLTSKVAHRGIVVWARGNSVNYLNRHTGNSDDLAYANNTVTQVECSARANLVAFAATGGSGFIDAPGNTTQSIYVKWLPK